MCSGPSCEEQHKIELEANDSITEMAGSSAFFRLVVILLGLSHLICLKAVPVTRSANLMQGSDQVHLIPENIHKVGREENWESWVLNRNERMDFQLDYTSPAANNRHTPKPPNP